MQFEKYPFEKLNELLAGVVPNKEYEPISLTIGEPQFKTPKFILDAICSQSALFNKYPKSAGEDFLKEAQINYLKRNFGIELEKEQIIPTFGTREVLFNFPQYFLFDKKNPVMAFVNPFYQIYEGAAIASRAKVLYLNLEKENGYKPILDKEKLKEVDLVILNTPSNPTASVMSLEELKEWAKAVLELDFLLINDECYIDLYMQEKIPSLLNAATEIGNRDFKNILVFNSISKRSSAPGIRSGFIAGDSEILKNYMRYRTYVGCAIPLPLQYGAAAAWEDDEAPKFFRAQYKKNFEIAKEILGVEIPQATFYIWLEVKDAIKNARELYEKYNVKVLPGEFLGREGAGKNFWRLALVYDSKKTTDALNRIKEFLS